MSNYRIGAAMRAATQALDLCGPLTERDLRRVVRQRDGHAEPLTGQELSLALRKLQRQGKMVKRRVPGTNVAQPKEWALVSREG